MSKSAKVWLWTLQKNLRVWWFSYTSSKILTTHFAIIVAPFKHLSIQLVMEILLTHTNWTVRMTLKVWILQSLRRLFIILVGLTMTWFSEKMLISNLCTHGLMPNLIKKSWTVSSTGPIRLVLSAALLCSAPSQTTFEHFIRPGQVVFSYSPINIKMVFYLEIFKEPFIADLGCSKIFIVDSSCTNCCRQLDTCMPETVSTIYFV